MPTDAYYDEFYFNIPISKVPPDAYYDEFYFNRSYGFQIFDLEVRIFHVHTDVELNRIQAQKIPTAK